MNTTAGSLSTEHSWLSGNSRSRRESYRERRYIDKHYYVLATESPHHSDDDDESILSIQAKETDYVQDTSDTDTETYNSSVEYEPASDAPSDQLTCSDESEEEIISTRVISVECAREEADADSEGSDAPSDPELGPHDYWRCAQCRNPNNNPLYRYCYKCFQVRKNLFPPRPKRKARPAANPDPADCEQTDQHLARCPSLPSLTSHTDSGFDSAYYSQEIPARAVQVPSLRELCSRIVPDSDNDSSRAHEPRRRKRRLSRRSDSAPKRFASTDSNIPAKAVVDCIRREVSAGDGDLCVVCCTEPKSGVFVHGKIAHICCCYRCAVRVWTSARRCPVCNCRVSNVLKAVVM